jgi:glycogen synthase
MGPQCLGWRCEYLRSVTIVTRIAIITPEYPGVRPSFGGIAAQYGALCPALVALGDDVHTFVVAAGEGPTVEQEGVVLHRVPVPPRTGPLFALARSIATRRTVGHLPRFDVAVVADWSGNGSLLRKPDGMPLVTHLHTCLALFLLVSNRRPNVGARASFRTRVQLKLERRQFEHSTTILACSHAILSAVSEFWNTDAIPSAVLPNVVDPQWIRSLANAHSKASGIPAGTPVIAVPGRLETRKGVGVLMRAMHDVWDAYPDAIVVFAGADGIVEGEAARVRLAELAGRHAGKVFFAGALPPRELFPTIAGADVVVTPSLWEAFGIATLEAMALGKRVVATSGSGYAEFCRDRINSILVPPNDVGELASGLLDALAGQSGALEGAAAATADEFGVKCRAPEYRDYLRSVAGLA